MRDLTVIGYFQLVGPDPDVHTECPNQGRREWVCGRIPRIGGDASRLPWRVPHPHEHTCTVRRYRYWLLPISQTAFFANHRVSISEHIKMISHWRRFFYKQPVQCVWNSPYFGVLYIHLSFDNFRTNAGLLWIGSLVTNFSEFLIRNQTFSFNKMHLKMTSAKWQPFCLGLNIFSMCGYIALWSLDKEGTRTCQQLCYQKVPFSLQI